MLNKAYAVVPAIIINSIDIKSDGCKLYTEFYSIKIKDSLKLKLFFIPKRPQIQF